MSIEQRMDILRRHLKPGVVMTHKRCMGILEEHHFTSWGAGERWICGNPARKPRRLAGGEYPVDDIHPNSVTHIDRVPLDVLDCLAEVETARAAPAPAVSPAEVFINPSCIECDDLLCKGTGTYDGRKCDGIPF